ncbi:MAG: nucleotidyltransferase domain-containing protein [Paramuribaculum sp.]|nr:nucleotidyltransferase domain-containing protein [Paramuribaculum sp.]
MCTSKECISLLKQNLPHIQAEFGVTRLCLFGSVARGDNRSDSDVDILVDMPPRILIVSALHRYLEELLHSSVDLIRYHSHLSSGFLKQISREGIKLL